MSDPGQRLILLDERNGMTTKRGGMKTKLTGALKTWRSLAGPKRSRPAGPRGDACMGTNNTADAIRLNR